MTMVICRMLMRKRNTASFLQLSCLVEVMTPRLARGMKTRMKMRMMQTLSSRLRRP
uniref:Uncharacterized protein n=1 Tax=Arundo donax TaxID=35708 RepID=A0A0A9CXH7_ARUDO